MQSTQQMVRLHIFQMQSARTISRQNIQNLYMKKEMSTFDYVLMVSKKKALKTIFIVASNYDTL